MFLFGHMGITLGAAVLLDKAISRSHPPSTQTEQQPSQVEQTKPSLLSKIDIRVLLVGALLPDIIDKPIGDFLFRETFSNGRIFSHTFLFLILITLAGFYLYHNYKKTWLLVLSFGALMHLILDQIWLEYQTLLWPLFGFAFEKNETDNVIDIWLNAMHTEPSAYIPEIIGAVILGWFFVVLIRRKKIHAFIKYGRIS